MMTTSMHTGVPFRFPTGLPLGPEEAVRHVYQATARRISKVPVAFEQVGDEGLGQLPLCASWRVRIEPPVWMWNEATGDGAARRVLREAGARVPLAGGGDVRPRGEPTSTRWFGTDLSGQDSVEVRVTGPVLFQRVKS